MSLVALRCVCVCVRAFVRACVRGRACVRACVRVCVRVCHQLSCCKSRAQHHVKLLVPGMTKKLPSHLPWCKSRPKPRR